MGVATVVQANVLIPPLQVLPTNTVMTATTTLLTLPGVEITLKLLTSTRQRCAALAVAALLMVVMAVTVVMVAKKHHLRSSKSAILPAMTNSTVMSSKDASRTTAPNFAEIQLTLLLVPAHSSTLNKSHNASTSQDQSQTPLILKLTSTSGLSFNPPWKMATTLMR